MTLMAPDWLFGQNLQNASEVAKVHVIFKTHLDVGFTRLSGEVIHTYFDQFIPKALDLATQIKAAANRDRYIWTTGSWLLWRYLKEASPENRKRMERSIEDGDIVWHALPHTTHSELADSSLFRLGIQLSKELDRRFGKTTIAAKMTDVPGHTRSIISVLAHEGVKFLHIGVNPASTPPDVPPLCTWQNPNGEKIILMYQMDYGSLMHLPNKHVAVSVNFTGDNHGPHSLEQINRIYAQLRTQFPAAEVVASTLDAVAADILPDLESLPLVTHEMGDTWIHGAASDPRKMADFRELSRLRKEWIRDGKLKMHSAGDLDFGEKLLRVAEHTWGLDVKTHLKDWEIYEPADFQKSRAKSNFLKIEESWREKREYLTEAVESLPEALAFEANSRLQLLRPVPPDNEEFKEIRDLGKKIRCNHFVIRFDPDNGSVDFLQENKSKRIWCDEQHPFGTFIYQTFSASDYNRFYDQYLTQRPSWALSDFGKPGLDKTSAVSAIHAFKPKVILHKRERDADVFRVLLRGINLSGTGAPAQVIMQYRLPDAKAEMEIQCSWFDKPANRMPEAIWLGFNPILNSESQWSLDKMGEPVDPFDVVRNGNRQLHGVQSGISCHDQPGGFSFETLDAFLIAPGAPSLLNFTNEQPDLSKGFHINLFNNVWGTNFAMWFGEDMLYRFTFKPLRNQ